ncbi:TetR family transcriptional regulator [Candidatus Enterococcus ferrettii]|uniref:HTH tetR-type domain-containing protein n=1 Tax=Candidatus Enterococcus ferrettii TaxID=2815324 RepID=A0ABV0EIT0_9ENTE|nr:TetR/AcrR family transcriptional regulator [Enterococcus sp. 665A]
MKNTRSNIMEATKKMIIEKGYHSMTTKDIAKAAQVNETTLFRQFGSKKELLLATLKEAEWIPDTDENLVDQFQWDLKNDLRLIMENYFQQVPPDIVRFSLGLRAQDIYQETLPYVQKIPAAFTQLIEEYLVEMVRQKKIKVADPKKTAEVLFSSLIGFAFLHAYSDNQQFEKENKAFIFQAVEMFSEGVSS